MVDHDDRVGLTAADRGPVGGRHVDGDVPCVRQDSGVEASQARTSAALRPSAWPSRPARTDRVDDRASLGTEGVHHGRQDRRGSRAAWMTVEPASRIRRPQPLSDPCTGRYLRDRLGERLPRALRLAAPSPELVPQERQPPLSIGHITRPGQGRPLHPRIVEHASDSA